MRRGKARWFAHNLENHNKSRICQDRQNRRDANKIIFTYHSSEHNNHILKKDNQTELLS